MKTHLSLNENIVQAQSSLRDLHNEVLQYTSDVTDDFGLKMTLSCLNRAHEKLAERTIAAIEDAKTKNDIDAWNLFASGLNLLNNLGPWFSELDQLNTEAGFQILAKTRNLIRVFLFDRNRFENCSS